LVFVSFASHIILRLVFSSGRFILLVEELWHQCLGTFPSRSVNICLNILMASWWASSQIHTSRKCNIFGQCQTR
jgi:hypothetical protein